MKIEQKRRDSGVIIMAKHGAVRIVEDDGSLKIYAENGRLLIQPLGANAIELMFVKWS